MKIPRIKRGIAILLCAVMTFGISIFTAIESVADDTVTSMGINMGISMVTITDMPDIRRKSRRKDVAF